MLATASCHPKTIILHSTWHMPFFSTLTCLRCHWPHTVSRGDGPSAQHLHQMQLRHGRALPGQEVACCGAVTLSSVRPSYVPLSLKPHFLFIWAFRLQISSILDICFFNPHVGCIPFLSLTQVICVHCGKLAHREANIRKCRRGKHIANTFLSFPPPIFTVTKEKYYLEGQCVPASHSHRVESVVTEL